MIPWPSYADTTGKRCDVCRERPATGGNIRRIAGREIITNYCDECGPKVPIGHRVWTTGRAYPSVSFAPQLLFVTLLVIAAMLIARWIGG
jgi:hypothetical protein